MKMVGVLLVLMSGFSFSRAFANQKVMVSTEAQSDMTHLEFFGPKTWVYELNKKKEGKETFLELTLEPLDPTSLAGLEKLSTPDVRRVEVKPGAVDNKDIIRIYLVNSEVEAFDYQTEQPSRLMIDIYRARVVAQNSSQASTGQELSRSDTQMPDLSKTPKKAKAKKVQNVSRVSRDVASTDIVILGDQGIPLAANLTQHTPNQMGLFDGGDPNFERFKIQDYEMNERRQFLAREQYYIPFPMIENPILYESKLKETPTIYEIHPKDGRENQEARLLVTLFDKKRFASYLKVLGWFHSRYPNSEYNEVLDYMTGDIQCRLYEQSQARSDYDSCLHQLRTAMEKHPGSSLFEQTSLRLGFIALRHSDFVNSTRSFQTHISKFTPQTGSIPISVGIAQIGLGHSLTELKRYDEALGVYNSIQEGVYPMEVVVEKNFRLGDFYAHQDKFAQANGAYESALKQFPESELQYPNARFNRAESLFHLKENRKSFDNYVEFVKLFPTHPHAALALTRIGELFEILGVDQRRSKGTYLETEFRYGEHPYSSVAKTHLLSWKLAEAKKTEVEDVLKKIKEQAERFSTPEMPRFSTIMMADGLSARKEYQRSIEVVESYIRENPLERSNENLVRRLVHYINANIHFFLDQRRHADVIRTYDKYSASWLKKSQRMDTKFALAQSLDALGAKEKAKEYYQEILNRVYALRGTPEAKMLIALDALPSAASINLKLATMAAGDDHSKDAVDYLKNISNPAELSEGEQVTRIALMADLFMKQGDHESALRYMRELILNWKSQPQQLVPVYMKLSALEEKIGKDQEALHSLDRIQLLSEDSSVLSDSDALKVLVRKSGLHMKLGKTEEYKEDLEKILSQFEERFPVASFRYRLGEQYYKEGQIQKAENVWKNFKGQNGNFWSDLATEKMKQAEWMGEYKRYLKRIPAMAEAQKGAEK